MNRFTKYLLLVSGLLIAVSSQAELHRAGPSDLPSPPGHGYPQWYQDTNGLALDLCVPQSLNQLDSCLQTPNPGDPLPAMPFSFPTNWPDEFFWYGAEGILDLGNGSRAVLVQAVEAAFGVGPTAVGDQVSFARIRVVMDAPVDGNYTVTFPYGQETFTDIKAGPRAIFFTSDIGIGAKGDFSGALKGAVGPFLTAVDAAGVAKPYFVIDGDSFLSDPGAETQVTGSPFNTNYFEICTDNPNGMGGIVNGAIISCVRTDTFALIGKVHTAPIASPLAIGRANYSTHAGMPDAHLDVFATAEAGPGAATPDMTVGAVGAASAHMIGPRNPGGNYYAQAVVPLASLPNSVTVINSADVPPSSVQAALVDAITISAANYDATTGVLTITAQSSDMASPPTLAAIGIPGSASGSDLLTAGALTLTLPVGTVPPRSVTVVSTHGGSSTVSTTMPTHGTPFPTGAPLAVNDMLSTGEGVAANFNVLANDGAEAVASSLNILTTATHGTATINVLNGTVDYVPVAGYFGADSFQYTVDSALGLTSNVATGEIDVIQINDAPVATDDLAAAPGLSVSVTVDVVANDTDADGIAPAPGGLDPATVTVTSTALGGSAFANGDGTVTFTKLGCEATIPASCSFTYNVSDNGIPALTSNDATVTVETGSNQPPVANADAASVLVDQSVTIDVAANDTDSDGSLNLASIVVSPLPANGSALDNGDGTITFGAGPNSGTTTFGYTIADNLGDRSGQATVTVTVNPNPDTLSIQRSECRAGKNEWRVDGSSSILAPHSITVHSGSTIAGPVIAANIPVDNLGAWRMSKDSGACISIVSFESSLGGKLENVFIPVN